MTPRQGPPTARATRVDAQRAQSAGWLTGALAAALLVATACAAPSAPAAKPTAGAAPAASPAAAAPSAAPVAAAKPAGAAPGAASGAPAPLSPAVPVKVGLLFSASDGGLLIGAERGYFREEGLDVELVQFDTGPAMFAPLATAQLDAGGPSPDATFFNAFGRNVPVKVVADKGSNSPGHGFNAILVRKDLWDGGEIRDFPDLRGRTIATLAPQNSQEIQLERGLTPAGLGLSDVRIVNMPFPDMLPALANRSVDVALNIEPFPTLAVDRGIAVRWKTIDEIYPNHQIAAIVYGPSFHQAQPEAARRFMVGYLRAVRDYVDAFERNRGRAEVIDIMTRTTSVKDAAVWERMITPGLNPDGQVNVDSIAADQDWFLAHGVVRERLDVSQIVDMQFVDYAVGRLGRYQR
jgi:ABC-type nitrate/sulfonate/bicarbonate transport system substrate-binding protein